MTKSLIMTLSLIMTISLTMTIFLELEPEISIMGGSGNRDI